MPRKKRTAVNVNNKRRNKNYKKVQPVQRTQETDRQKAISKFHSAISQGPIYPCFSCKRLLFKDSVRPFKPNAIAPCDDLKALLDDAKIKEDKGVSLHICRTCSLGLSKGKIPCQCYLNNLNLETVPPELENLNPIEERLIAQRIPFMKIVALACGGQKAIHGNCVNVPSRLDGICSLLPRIPEDSHMIPLKIKRRLGHDKSYMSSYVRPQKVNDALRYLLLHNPLYRDCQYGEHWQLQWQNDEADLWAAMTEFENNQTETETPVPSCISDFPEQKHSSMKTFSESPIPSVLTKNKDQKDAIFEYDTPTPFKKIKVEHHESEDPMCDDQTIVIEHPVSKNQDQKSAIFENDVPTPFKKIKVEHHESEDPLRDDQTIVIEHPVFSAFKCEMQPDSKNVISSKSSANNTPLLSHSSSNLHTPTGTTNSSCLTKEETPMSLNYHDFPGNRSELQPDSKNVISSISSTANKTELTLHNPIVKKKSPSNNSDFPNKFERNSPLDLLTPSAHNTPHIWDMDVRENKSCSILHEKKVSSSSPALDFSQVSPFLSDDTVIQSNAQSNCDYTYECPFPNHPVNVAPTEFNVDMLCHDVPGDGNCLFHAIHLSCMDKGMTIPKAAELRQAVCDYLQSSESDWIDDFLLTHDATEHISKADYVQHIKEPDINSGRQRQFADNIELIIVSKLFGLSIQIFRVVSGRLISKLIQSAPDVENGFFINVLYQDGIHYLAMVDPMHRCEHPQIQNCVSSVQSVRSPVGQQFVFLTPPQSLPVYNKTTDLLSPNFEFLPFSPVMAADFQEQPSSELQGLFFDSILLKEQQVPDTSIYSVAPGEYQRPLPILTDENFEALAFPCKFPSGTGSFSETRPVKLNFDRYLNQRLLNEDGRFSKDIDYIMSCQYAKELKTLRESLLTFMRQTYQQHRSTPLDVGFLRQMDNVDRLVRSDYAFRFLKNTRGSPAFWNSVLLDLLAMVRQLGPPTWFLTLSAADMHWPEVIKSIALQYGIVLSDNDVKNMSWNEKASWIRKNPITASRMFVHRLSAFFRLVICDKSNPIGEVVDFMYRNEFQNRGSPHGHCLLWVKDAPKFGVDSDNDVEKFIDSYQTCSLDIEDDNLRDMVSSVQRHVHSKSCRPKGFSYSSSKSVPCRFSFPQPPSKKTILAKKTNDVELLETKKQVSSKVQNVLADETNRNISLDAVLQKADVEDDLYHKCLAARKQGDSIVLKRLPNESYINYYNKHIIQAWGANMDLQYITNTYACIAYVTSYMMKAEGVMSEVLEKVVQDNIDDPQKTLMSKVGQAFLNNREVSAQECAIRCLGLPLKRCSRPVVFVNTSHLNKRIRMLKPTSRLTEMDASDTDIFYNSMIDRYAARPECLEFFCLADFVANYRVDYSKKQTDPEDPDGVHDDATQVLNDVSDELPKKITLGGNLGVMTKRKQLAVIRFHKERNDVEEKCRIQLMLYYPWRNELTDLIEDGSHERKFVSNQLSIHINESKYSINAENIDQAFEDLQTNGPPEGAWDTIAPHVRQAEAEALEEGIVAERNVSAADQVNIDLEFHQQHTTGNLYTKEADKAMITLEEYKEMMLSLNSQQRSFIEFHTKWCMDVVSALKENRPCPQNCIFLSGPGGVGKSHIIKLVHYETMARLKQLTDCFEPSEIPVLLVAPTGTAAFNIHGMTLHSAFSLSGDLKSQYKPLGCSKLNTLRSSLGKLKLVVIDEISMVGADVLHYIHRRLEEITQDSSSPFGGVSILAVGDLYQLPPVKAQFIFKDPSNDYAKIYGSLWKHHFKIFELSQPMRHRNDVEFSEILLRIRTKSQTANDINKLKERLITPNDPNYPTDALHIFATNAEVDQHNSKKLSKLHNIVTLNSTDKDKDIETNQATVTFSDKISETGGMSKSLEIAIGARVMLTSNIDVSDGLVNGVFGTVVAFDGDSGSNINTIFVDFDEREVGKKIRNAMGVPIKRQCGVFTASRKSHIKASRKQFPLTLAWASTIHKVQGKTVGEIVVSLKKNSVRTPGLAYVALSRVRTFQGLHLLNFDEKSISTSAEVVQEMDRLPKLIAGCT